MLPLSSPRPPPPGPAPRLAPPAEPARINRIGAPLVCVCACVCVYSVLMCGVAIVGCLPCPPGEYSRYSAPSPPLLSFLSSLSSLFLTPSLSPQRFELSPLCEVPRGHGACEWREGVCGPSYTHPKRVGPLQPGSIRTRCGWSKRAVALGACVQCNC